MSYKPAVARRMIERGWHPIVLARNGKRPIDVGWQATPVHVGTVHRLMDDPRLNLGWRMGLQPNGCRLLAIDDDGELPQLEERIEQLPQTWMQVTPSGGKHLLYRVPIGPDITNRVRVRGVAVDLRCDGGQIAIAPSIIDGQSYVACVRPIAELPARWLAELTAREEPPPSAPAPASQSDALTRALRYTEQCEPAVSGSGGHRATWRVACCCVQFGLDIDQTMVVLRQYNTRCAPPWSEQQLMHKAQSAQRQARVARGGKL